MGSGRGGGGGPWAGGEADVWCKALLLCALTRVRGLLVLVSDPSLVLADPYLAAILDVCAQEGTCEGALVAGGRAVSLRLSGSLAGAGRGRGAVIAAGSRADAVTAPVPGVLALEKGGWVGAPGLPGPGGGWGGGAHMKADEAAVDDTRERERVKEKDGMTGRAAQVSQMGAGESHEGEREIESPGHCGGAQGGEQRSRGGELGGEEGEEGARAAGSLSFPATDAAPPARRLEASSPMCGRMGVLWPSIGSPAASPQLLPHSDIRRSSTPTSPHIAAVRGEAGGCDAGIGPGGAGGHWGDQGGTPGGGAEVGKSDAAGGRKGGRQLEGVMEVEEGKESPGDMARSPMSVRV